MMMMLERVGIDGRARGLGERSDSGPGARSVACPAGQSGVNAARVRGCGVGTTTRHGRGYCSSLGSFGSDVGERADRSTAQAAKKSARTRRWGDDAYVGLT